MERFTELIRNNEDWLMARVLNYALERGYTKYTSTLQEAWRLSISGLSESLLAVIREDEVDLELQPDEEFSKHPAASFGIVEAGLHRERGVSLGMFLGLMKYYRQSYIDLVRQADLAPVFKTQCLHLVDRFFDRVEIGFCVEWSASGESKLLEELQSTNRFMTNEKNKYLTVFESLASPVIFVDPEGMVENMNQAASELFRAISVPGAQYYRMPEGTDTQVVRDQVKEPAERLFPWLMTELGEFEETDIQTKSYEKVAPTSKGERRFILSLSRMLDISGKFRGTVFILTDVTERRRAEEEKEKAIDDLKATLAEVKTLRGFLPICANCKKIRDDEGYWQLVEEYIEDRSEAQFSHGICPGCARELYPELYRDES
jgi:PAS domain-containing protein